MQIELTQGVINTKGKKAIFYGPEGVGKTTLAMQLPDPVFVDTEGSTDNYNVKRLPKPNSLDELKEIIGWVTMNPDQLKTLVIDTGDWLEHMLVKDFCVRKGISNLGDMGYGKGYEASAKEFQEMLDLFNVVLGLGINVVFNCHSQVKTFSMPDDMGSYDRYELKMEKKHIPLLKEWADLIGFINFKTNLIYQNNGDKKAKAVGGQDRMIYFTHNAAYDAKNRFGLPDTAPLSYDVLRPVFEPGAPAPTTRPMNFPNQPKDTLEDFTTEEYVGVNEDLLQQMVLNDISALAIQEACHSVGLVNSKDIPLKNYPAEIQTYLTQIFPQVKEHIMQYGFGLPF